MTEQKDHHKEDKAEQPTMRSYAHQRLDYDFNYPQFAYEAGIQYQPCVKISLFFRKREDVSYEHFYTHWATVHADMTAASRAFGRHRILRYTQHHAKPATRDKVRQLGVDVLDYDGCTTMWVRDWDDIIAFHASDDFQRMVKDCDNFLDQTPGGLRAMAGHDVIVVGAPIPGVDATGGVAAQETGQGWKDWGVSTAS